MPPGEPAILLQPTHGVRHPLQPAWDLARTTQHHALACASLAGGGGYACVTCVPCICHHAAPPPCSLFEGCVLRTLAPTPAPTTATPHPVSPPPPCAGQLAAAQSADRPIVRATEGTLGNLVCDAMLWFVKVSPQRII